jgi:hypothetical protein
MHAQTHTYTCIHIHTHLYTQTLTEHTLPLSLLPSKLVLLHKYCCNSLLHHHMSLSYVNVKMKTTSKQNTLEKIWTNFVTNQNNKEYHLVQKPYAQVVNNSNEKKMKTITCNNLQPLIKNVSNSWHKHTKQKKRMKQNFWKQIYIMPPSANVDIVKTLFHDTTELKRNETNKSENERDC